MATFTDLIEALSWEPVDASASGVEGRDWRWTFSTPEFDLSATTGVCPVAK